MTTLFFANGKLIIGLNRTIVFVEPHMQTFERIELPKQLSIEESPYERTETSGAIPLRIQHVKYAPNGQLLVLTTSGQKCLLLYQIAYDHIWLQSTHVLPHGSSALTFSEDSKSILMIDKTGNCYLYDYTNENMKVPARLVMSHLGIVNDMLWSADRKYIITCSQDKDIRITNFFKKRDIHGFCVGHTQFVSSLKFLNQNVIASISGDKTLRIWNYESCRELVKIELPGAAVRFDIFASNNTNYNVAVLQQDSCICFYSLTENEDEDWISNDVSVHKFPDLNACNLCYDDEFLYVTGVINNKFVLKTIPISSNTPLPDLWLEIEKMFQKYIWTPEDIKN